MQPGCYSVEKLVFRQSKGLPLGKPFFIAKTRLQQRDARLFAFPDRLLVPDRALHLADVGDAQKQHAQPRLADAAADGVGELTRQKRLVEGELPAYPGSRG